MNLSGVELTGVWKSKEDGRVTVTFEFPKEQSDELNKHIPLEKYNENITGGLFYISFKEPVCYNNSFGYKFSPKLSDGTIEEPQIFSMNETDKQKDLILRLITLAEKEVKSHIYGFLLSVKEGKDLAGLCGYGLNKECMSELALRHRDCNNDEMKEKIEDLLTSCHRYEERKDFIDGRYNEYLTDAQKAPLDYKAMTERAISFLQEKGYGNKEIAENILNVSLCDIQDLIQENEREYDD